MPIHSTARVAPATPFALFALAALLGPLAAARATPAPQEIQVGAAEGERRSASAFFYTRTEDSFVSHGQVEIGYGSPAWQDSYPSLLAEAEPGTRLRLGKDFWTTLDANLPLRIGGQRVAAGTYYLALETRSDGALALLLLDAAAVRERRLHSGQTAETDGGIAVPLERHDTGDIEPQLEIALEPRPGVPPGAMLALRWGTLRMHATIEAGGLAAAAAAAPAAAPAPAAPPDANRMTPDRAPTPFSAAEIRAGCPAGRTAKYRIEVPGKRDSFRVMEFVTCTEDGAEVESRIVVPGRVVAGNAGDAGDVVAAPERQKATWTELQSHASFPAASTEISTETLTIPVGTFDCWHYAVHAPDVGPRGVRHYWFAKDLPGPPIRLDQMNGDLLTMRMTVVESNGKAKGKE